MSRFDCRTTIAVLIVWLASNPVFCQIVINEILAENRLTILDEDEDDSDWVELYNPGDTPQSLAGYALSDDLETPRKWTFPDVTLGPGEFATVWCSGKDRTQATREAIERSTAPFSPTFSPMDAEWRYLTDSPEAGSLPEGWNELEFDDSAWSGGRSPFGFGDEGIRTTLPQNMGAVLFRRAFPFDGGERPARLVLRACLDDGMLVFLNGTLVLTENVREGPLSFASIARASTNCDEQRLFDLSDHVNLLEPGENLLAIALLNIRPNNNDLNLQAELGTTLPVLHTSFKISREGEPVLLTDPAGTLVDFVDLPPQAEDHSYGRIPDGGNELFYLLRPTPTAPNGTRFSEDIILAAPRFEPVAGRYAEALTVTLSGGTAFADLEVRYTLDGTAPSPESALFTAPIQVVDDTVIRAASFLDGEVVTRTVSASYFLNAHALASELPVLSVSMAPDDFAFVHNNGELRGPTGEREGYLEVFDPTGTPGAGTGFGLRIHGGAGRGGDFTAQKSYKLYFRGVYGDKKLRYPLFAGLDEDVFDRLVLRSTFNDSFRGGAGTYLRDQIIRDLHEEMGGLVTHGAFYHLYVNMEYRGLYNLVERMDASFFEAHVPEEGEDWDVVKFGAGEEALEGSLLEWGRLRNFLRANDLQRADLFEEAAQLLELGNFTSYMIVNLWAQNHDWPHQNWYTARARQDGARWRFLIWDAESSMGPGDLDTLAHIFSRGRVSSLTTIFEELLESPLYQRFFLDELDRHLATTLSAENVVAHIDRLAARVGPDMDLAVLPSGVEVATWERNVDLLRAFARQRPSVVRAFVGASDRFTVAPTLSFRRGDANDDGVLNIVDPIEILRQLLTRRDTPTCADARDVDDLGDITLTDAVFLLNFLFQPNAPPPAPPHRTCGSDTTADPLGCDGQEACD